MWYTIETSVITNIIPQGSVLQLYYKGAQNPILILKALSLYALLQDLLWFYGRRDFGTLRFSAWVYQLLLGRRARILEINPDFVKGAKQGISV